MGLGFNQGTNRQGVPSVFGLFSSDLASSSKIPEDSYKVFVNNDFVGEKTLYSPVETIDDVGKYLQNQGYNNFSSNLTGNEYTIKASGADAREIKNVLNVYLNNR